MHQRNKKIKPAIHAVFALAITGIMLAGFGFLAHSARAEWYEPTSNPPATADAFNEPLTTGPENQAKAGFLELWPDYDITQSGSFTPPQKPLDIKGRGAKFSTAYVYDDILAVDKVSDAYTLYANSLQGWVGIGTRLQSDNVKLKVEGDTVQAGSETAPLSGRAISGYSSNGAGLTASTGTSANASGVYGLRSGSANGQAVLGDSAFDNGLKGESAAGQAVYAVNESLDQGTVYGRNDGTGWAGYFKGFLGAGADVVAPQFLPRGLNKSVIPFTSGQEVATYSFGNWATAPVDFAMTFDGTHLWIGNGAPDSWDVNLFKIRAADGKMDQWFNRFETSTWGISADAFDGRYVWGVDDERIRRFDPATRQVTAADIGRGGSIYSIVSSVINGETYIWVPDETNNSIIRVKQSDLTFQAFSLAVYGVNYPRAVTFDGEYVWVATWNSGFANSEHIVKLWATDPTDAGHPATVIDTTTSNYICKPRGVYFDGTYVWCLPGSGSNQLLRLWAADPLNDTRHPPKAFGPATGDLQYMMADGTYLWVADYAQSRLYRFLIADPNQSTYFQLAYKPTAMAFDGTYLYVAEGAIPARIHKYFTGSGNGSTDLNTVVYLDARYGYCGGSGEYQCRSNSDCPVAQGTCPVQFAADQQTGSINISKDAQLLKGHCFYSSLTKHRYSELCQQDSECTVFGVGQCIGGDLTVGGDVQATANQWGGADESVAVGGVGINATCPSGKFMNGLVLNSSSVPTSIICNGL